MTKKIKNSDLLSLKRSKTKISAISCYDYTTARLVSQGQVDMILVGDSAGMVMAGRKDTLGVTLDEMLHFTRWAAEGIEQPWRTKFERRSKKFTTDWGELPKVK